MADILSRWYGCLPYLYILYKGVFMWKLEIIFSDEEVVTFKGPEYDIPLTVAIRYYDLFVKEAGGIAVYRQKDDDNPILLSEKLLQMVN